MQALPLSFRFGNFPGRSFKMEMKTVSSSITKKEHDLLVVMAAYRECSISNVIREAIQGMIDKENPPLGYRAEATSEEVKSG